MCGKIGLLAARKRASRGGGRAIRRFPDSLAIGRLLAAFET
ncbi:hypothetical protein HMPREF9404_4577 [Eggerthella sp. HGA1]|nr:hypothetical protein HMPREF9404_4577 [Eggerthella sp. HGA1]